MIRVNMDKAREIKRNHLRAERAGRLDALDVAFMRAVEAGDATAQADIAAQKQVLRDVTADPRIEAATTTDELKALTLDALLA